MKIRVMLVDDSWQAREGMWDIVSADPAFEVVGEAASGEEAMVLAGKMQPDMIVMDIHMPGVGGFATLKWIRAVHPAITTIMVTASESSDLDLEALRYGAQGCLQKNLDPAAWRDYLRAFVREKTMKENEHASI